MSGQKKGKEAVLFPGERLDDLQLNGLELIQDPKKFCFGVDAVFLSDFVKIKAGERALDLGTGNGIIPILLSEKTLLFDRRKIFIFVDRNECRIKYSLKIKFFIQRLCHMQNLIIRLRCSAYDHLRALSCRNKLRHMTISLNFILIFR